MYATANNQFVVRGAGGIKMYTATNLSAGVEVAAGGGSWSSISDRNRKENFQTVDTEEFLARISSLPLTTWNYIAEGRETRHIGPMAQDWHRAFALNSDSLRINTGDFDGVNLAGIQALEKRTADQRAELDEQSARIESLEQRVQELESLVRTFLNQGIEARPASRD